MVTRVSASNTELLITAPSAILRLHLPYQLSAKLIASVAPLPSDSQLTRLLLLVIVLDGTHVSTSSLSIASYLLYNVGVYDYNTKSLSNRQLQANMISTC